MFRAPTNALYEMMPQPTCLPSISKMPGNRGCPLKVNCWKPVWLVKNARQQRVSTQGELLEACVVSENNINLTSAQKELVHWHFHLCHQGFDSLQ